MGPDLLEGERLIAEENQGRTLSLLASGFLGTAFLGGESNTGLSVLAHEWLDSPLRAHIITALVVLSGGLME